MEYAELGDLDNFNKIINLNYKFYILLAKNYLYIYKILFEKLVWPNIICVIFLLLK